MIATTTNPWLSHSAVIDRIDPESPGVNTYHLRFADPAIEERFMFLPGQFNMLYLPGCGEIAISISDDPKQRGVWAHTIRVAGNATRELARLGTGGALGLRGPYGTHWPSEECRGADVVLVAGGIGMAPLRPVVYELLSQPANFESITLLYGARVPSDLLFTREFADWRSKSLDVQITVDRCEGNWTGNVGVVSLLLERLQPFNPANTCLMVCGPEVMMHYTAIAAMRRGMTKDRIWLSLERNMQCAVGMCGHCQLGPAFICKDGPVFRYDKIEPFMNVRNF